MTELETLQLLHSTQEHLQEARDNLQSLALDLAFSWNDAAFTKMERGLKVMQLELYTLAGGEDDE